MKLKKLIVKEDSRGWVAEIMGPRDVRSLGFGQLIVTTAKPGQIKGNHYHKRKTEWYCVLKGKGILYLKENKTGKIQEISLEEKKLSLVEIPPNYTHSIKNAGSDDIYVISYTNEPFNELDKDTYR